MARRDKPTLASHGEAGTTDHVKALLQQAAQDAAGAQALARHVDDRLTTTPADPHSAAAEVAQDCALAATAYLEAAHESAADIAALSAGTGPHTEAVGRVAQAAAGAKAMRTAARHAAQAAAGGYSLDGTPTGTCVEEAGLP